MTRTKGIKKHFVGIFPNRGHVVINDHVLVGRWMHGKMKKIEYSYLCHRIEQTTINMKMCALAPKQERGGREVSPGWHLLGYFFFSLLQ